ncbi:hypothetical protein [Aeromonas phage Akh-2]|nr:hypothetical protein [Aeromonas phage Akh-2]
MVLPNPGIALTMPSLTRRPTAGYSKNRLRYNSWDSLKVKLG